MLEFGISTLILLFSLIALVSMLLKLRYIFIKLFKLKWVAEDFWHNGMAGTIKKAMHDFCFKRVNENKGKPRVP